MPDPRRRMIRVAALAVCVVLFVFPASALLSPAMVYCKELGYEYTVEQTPLGAAAYCLLPNGEKADDWAFLQGKVGKEYSYCEQQGYELRTVTDRETCSRFQLDTCAVCVLEDGKTVEVTDLMGLEFWETSCGDGACSDPENYLTCPQDCGPDSADGYCNPAMAASDPDCMVETGDTVAPPMATEAPLGFTTILLGCAIAVLCGRRIFR
jgi:putative hemolysin